MIFDCIIVGAGFSGSVIARKLAEQDKKVLILERRNHIAGNMYDERDAGGIIVQKYGPHIFHANSKEVYDFITKYDAWIDYRHCPAVDLDGIITPSPANYTTIDLLYNKNEAEALKTHLETCYAGRKTVTIPELLECDDPVIKKYAEKLCEMNYRPYTAKQWGISVDEIDPGVLKRVPVRLDYTTGYFDSEFQCMPKNGYTCFFEKLLTHKNIEIMLNTNALDKLKIDTDNKHTLFDGKMITTPLVYTGAIDELLNYRYGQLPYRSLRFEYQTKNTDSFLEAPVVAYPKADGYTRITEFKKLPPQNIPGTTVVAFEYPLHANIANKNEPFYPVLTEDNTALFNRYRSDLNGIPNLFLCGRLAEYKYYDMDAVILRAFEVCEKI